MEADFQTLKAQAQLEGQPAVVCGRPVQRLKLGGHQLYAVKMGSGAVESAVSAAALLARFRCDIAVSIGPVGALDDALVVGEWREVEKVINYQKGSWAPDGFQSAQDAAGEAPDKKTPRPAAAIAKPVLQGVKVAGPLIVASGEVFVASSDYRSQLRARTGAQAVDMNLFGITTACASAGVPLWSWRVISDRADNEASAAFRAFVERYDGAGGRAIAETIRGLPADPNAPESYPALKRLLAPPGPAPGP